MFKIKEFKKINLINLIIFFSCILQTNLCFSEWINIAENEDKFFYIESKMIIPHMDSRRMAKELHEFRAPIADGTTSLRIKSEFDCEAQKVRVLAQDRIAGEMGVGKIISLDTKVTPWKDVKFDSARLKVLNFVCSFEQTKY